MLIFAIIFISDRIAEVYLWSDLVSTIRAVGKTADFEAILFYR